MNRLLFIEDLKIYAESDQKLNQLVQAVHEFSRDIKMEFGLDKCSKCTIKKGKKVTSENIQVGEESYIEDLDEDTTYKYLGIEENATNRTEENERKNIKGIPKLCKEDL